MIGIRAPRPGALRLYMAAAGGVATAPGIVDVQAIALGLHTNIVFLPKHRKNCECCPGHYLSTSVC